MRSWRRILAIHWLKTHPYVVGLFKRPQPLVTLSAENLVKKHVKDDQRRDDDNCDGPLSHAKYSSFLSNVYIQRPVATSATSNLEAASIPSQNSKGLACE